MGSFSVCFGMLRGLVEFSHPSVKMAVTISLFGDCGKTTQTVRGKYLSGHRVYIYLI